jgi:Domain of unknown function (DUF4919)
MIARALAPYLPIMVMLWWQAPPPGEKADAQPPGNPSAQNSPDERFESLLTAAMKEPKKADWNALRHTFAQTRHYRPYNTEWKSELDTVRKDLSGDNLKAAETALEKLLERERFMRLDAMAMAVALYEKKGDKDKAKKHRDLLDELTRAVFVPGRGMSFEKPIEVLFIDEEYFFLGSMRIRPRMQSLREQNGRRFDVFTIPATRNLPEHEIYFNIDMPYNALRQELQRAFENKQPEGKK